MPVKQYPHTIILKGNSQDALFEDGIWIIPNPEADTEQPCRYEPATLNRELSLADGVTVKYKGIVYLPLSTPDIAEGLLVEITDVITTKTLYFYRGQMNCTLYL